MIAPKAGYHVECLSCVSQRNRDWGNGRISLAKAEVPSTLLPMRVPDRDQRPRRSRTNNADPLAIGRFIGRATPAITIRSVRLKLSRIEPQRVNDLAVRHGGA